jgi:hypothetical protein
MKSKDEALNKRTLENLKSESKSRKIRVGFAIMYASAFPAMPLFELLNSSKNFDASLVLIPDALRSGNDPLRFVTDQFDSLGNIGYPIQFGVDRETGQLVDVFRDFDLVCFSTPYSEMTFEVHSITHLTERGKLAFYIGYSFGVSTYDLHFLPLPHISKLWLAFVPTSFHRKRWSLHSSLSKKQIYVSGYPKLDALSVRPRPPSVRKRIILAPHHSVATLEGDWSLGDFLRLADRYAELPTKYPNVDFVFRSHPLLKDKLEDECIWGKAKTVNYFKQLTDLPNVSLSESGDYMELFAESDAMIHNSGSFTAEYLYTSAPIAFMVDDIKILEKSLNEFGRECLKNHYILYSSDDTFRFIEEVVVRGHDQKKWSRNKFVQRKMHSKNQTASQRIVRTLESLIVGRTSKFRKLL